MDWMAVAFYTMDAPYATVMQKLQLSLSRFEIPHLIEGIKSRGTWTQNVHYGSQLVLRALNMFPKVAIVLIDADSEIVQYPALFDTIDCDFAAHLHMWDSGDKDLFCGTMYFQNNETTKAFLGNAIERHGVCPSELQQPGMLALLNDWKGNIRFESLPPEYCYLGNRMEPVTKPVIVHHGISRAKKEQERQDATKNLSHIDRLVEELVHETDPTTRTVDKHTGL